MSDLVGDRPVPGMPDARPDRVSRREDRSRDQLVIERSEIPLRPSTADYDYEI